MKTTAMRRKRKMRKNIKSNTNENHGNNSPFMSPGNLTN